VTPPWAYAVITVTYVVGFGWGVWSAFSYLLSSSARTQLHSATGFTVSDVVSSFLTLLALAIAIPLLNLEAPTWWRPAADQGRWRTEARAFGLATVCISIGLGVSTILLDMPAYPRGSGTGAAWGDLLNALLAGPAEEIVVLVIPLIFLRVARWPWWAVITVAVILRLLYHVYYGPSAAGLALWALGMIAVYLRTHAVLGLVLAHSWYDASSTIASYWSEPVGILLAAAPLSATASVYWTRGVRALSSRWAPTGEVGG
jgi:membrane protease YdiL (CAAX protease family)